jgi:alkylation response protein AidB-like acyl-CoA dehydrogenase
MGAMVEPDADLGASGDRFSVWHERLNAIGDPEASVPQRFSRERWELIRQSGILRLPFDRRYGGLGEDLPTTMRALESLGQGCRDAGLSFSVCTHMVSVGIALQSFGADALKERYMRRVCDGSTIGAHAITEPMAGSDMLAMQTRAIDRGDRYLLSGAKAFVTNGPVADVLVVYARTAPAVGPFGITAFVLDRATPGLRIGAPIPTMGLSSAPLGEVVLEECAVDATNVIGTPGSGFLVLEHVMRWEILCTFVASVGAMQRRLEQCIAHARARRQFGRAIGSFQSVANTIVEMKIAIETARRWLYDSATRLVHEQDASIDIAIAKLLASEANVASALAAIQIFGANGYTTAYGLEADLRDAVAGTIYSGTSEIQRNRIARLLGLGGDRRGSRAGTPASVEA